MNELKIFEKEEFGSGRTIEENGKVLFCGKDIADALGYVNPSKALNDHCRGVTKRYVPHPQAPDKMLEMTFIPEGDVYRLITHSKLPGAERFERWVFDEVLPTIRRHGMYATDDLLNDPDLAIKAFTALNEERERNKLLQAQNEAMKPKALFADAVATSKTSILVGDLAKLIKQNGVEIGQKRLFVWLRENGYLIKYGSDYNMPTQRSMQMGLFEIKESTTNNPDGSVRINRTTKVTGKGQQYFINKFLS
jgi:anti-repressor protein